MNRLLLVCKSDTTIGETVGQTSELGPDSWDLERDALKAISRDGLAWFAEQSGARLTGSIRWTLFDITHSLFPHSSAPVVDQGVWG